MSKVRVLFLCTHNSARSQMAEGLLRSMASDRFEARSAGTVATQVRPEAIAAMLEVGIDIAGQESKTLECFLDQPFDLVVTVCDAANAACPVFLGGGRRLHWSIPDPTTVTTSQEARLDAFRAARDDIRLRIEEELIGEPGNADSPFVAARS